MTKSIAAIILSVLTNFLISVNARAEEPISALIVSAHPDDESCLAATTYKLTTELGGVVDQVVITNGEGGYRYARFAEPFYGLKLTDEAVARARLPEIRKQELLNAGRILGIRRHYFLDQMDAGYTQDVNEALGLWDVGLIESQLHQILKSTHYDAIFILFPTPDTHGHHKAAAVLTIETVSKMEGGRPIVLGCQNSTQVNLKQLDWSTLAGFPQTASYPDVVFTVDRNQHVGFKSALTYQVIANWEIAEHKSQGLFQMDMDRYDLEAFALMDVNADALNRARRIFSHLQPATLTSSRQTLGATQNGNR